MLCVCVCITQRRELFILKIGWEKCREWYLPFWQMAQGSVFILVLWCCYATIQRHFQWIYIDSSYTSTFLLLLLTSFPLLLSLYSFSMSVCSIFLSPHPHAFLLWHVHTLAFVHQARSPGLVSAAGIRCTSVVLSVRQVGCWNSKEKFVQRTTGTSSLLNKYCASMEVKM